MAVSCREKIGQEVKCVADRAGISGGMKGDRGPYD